MNARVSLILLSDDESAGVNVSQILQSHGCDLRVLRTVDEMQIALPRMLPSLLVVDYRTRDLDAAALCASLRQQVLTGRLPLIVLGAEGDDEDQMRCLDRGADDWIAREQAQRLLLVRVKALLRRSDPLSFRGLLRLGSLALDDAARRLTVLCDGRRREAQLSPTECRLLRYLMSNPHTPLTRSELLLNVWGNDSGIESRTVDVHINRLREVLSRVGCEEQLETIRGVGYRFIMQPGTVFA